jgi:hypothetical protein
MMVLLLNVLPTCVQVELVPLPPHVEAACELQCHNLKDMNNSSELQIKDGHNNYMYKTWQP